MFHRPDLAAALPAIEADLARTLGDGFDLEWTITDQSAPKRMAILASKQDHCLLDLLWRHRRGDLPVTIPMVISNHTTAAEDVRSFGVPFFHVPSTPGPDKSASEAEILEAPRRQRRLRGARPLHADPLARLPRRSSACR